MRVKSDLRHELKFILTLQQAHALRAELHDHLRLDTYSGAGGGYRVTSLYYDTVDYKAYRDKLNGEKFRRKVRVRVYGEQSITPEASCFLEIKQRVNQMINKKRVVLPYASVLTLENRTALPSSTIDTHAGNRVWQEVAQLFQTLQLQPACLVQYQRTAFESHEVYPDLRVTIDTNLRYRTQVLSLLKDEQAANAYFLAPDSCVLEVKVNQSVPYWLATVLTKHGCRLQRISKYCAALGHSQAVRQGQPLRLSIENSPPSETAVAPCITSNDRFGFQTA